MSFHAPTASILHPFLSCVFSHRICQRKNLRVTAVNGNGLWTKKEMLVPQESLLLPWDQQVHISDINWPRNKNYFRLIISTNRVTCFFLMSVNRNFQKKKKHVS